MLEESREYHLHRALVQLEGNPDLFDSDYIKANPEEVQAAYERHADFLDELGKRIWAAPADQPTLDDLAAWAEERAREGARIVIIDPVTAATSKEDIWVADSQFLSKVKQTALRHHCSILLVTHPKKGHAAPSLDDLAGGAAYQRFSQTVLWLEKFKQARSVIAKTAVGRTTANVNAAIHICKARNARGHGLSIGLQWDHKTLQFAEVGLILGTAKKQQDGLEND